MTRKEVKVFREVESQLKEAYAILKTVEVKNPTDNYGKSLDHARVQVLLAECEISHQVFLKEKGKW